MIENQIQLTAVEQSRVETFGHLAPNEYLDQILAQRQARYGTFAENAAISQRLKDQMRLSKGWDRLEDDMKEALEMIALKISRILCGDPRYDDSWVDIAGFAARIADRLKAYCEENKGDCRCAISGSEKRDLGRWTLVGPE